MRRRVHAYLVLVLGVVLLASCRAEPDLHESAPVVAPSTSFVMPDLIGLPSATAGQRLGELELSSSWGVPMHARCGQRPRTVVWQRPEPGTPMDPGANVHVRTAALNLDVFRGPCNPAEGDLGPLAGPDARLARDFYRFAADPSLGAPFSRGEVWVGIENGLTSVSIGDAELQHLAAWELETAYAESLGPFSALDTLAYTGGYYELHRGIAGTCPTGNNDPPPQMAGLRAISLTAPADVTSSCMEWWAVTLFLNSQNQIQGVALRLGSP